MQHEKYIFFSDKIRNNCILVHGKLFWSSRFELWAPQVPLIIRETFGEILGPRRPTISEPRPAQKLGVK